MFWSDVREVAHKNGAALWHTKIRRSRYESLQACSDSTGCWSLHLFLGQSTFFFLQAGVRSYSCLWMRVPFILHKCHVTASIIDKNFIQDLHLQLPCFFVCFTVIFSKCRKQTGSESKLQPKSSRSWFRASSFIKLNKNQLDAPLFLKS
jgi:hypothetical protein